LVIAAAAILTPLAATYQPVTYTAGSGSDPFPGLPQGKGLRWINSTGLVLGDLYIPPQRGPFTISASITNTGTHAVTIEGISLLRVGGRYWPVAPAGPARYYRGGSQQTAMHLLKNVTLRPGDLIIIGIPVRTDPCASKTSWVRVDTFGVRERFLFFTHTVQIPFSTDGGRLLMHTPAGDQGGPDVFCVSP